MDWIQRAIPDLRPTQMVMARWIVEHNRLMMECPKPVVCYIGGRDVVSKARKARVRCGHILCAPALGVGAGAHEKIANSSTGSIGGLISSVVCLLRCLTFFYVLYIKEHPFLWHTRSGYIFLHKAGPRTPQCPSYPLGRRHPHVRYVSLLLPLILRHCLPLLYLP